MEDEATMAVNAKENKKSTQGEEWHLYEPHLLCIADTCSVLVTLALNAVYISTSRDLELKKYVGLG